VPGAHLAAGSGAAYRGSRRQCTYLSAAIRRYSHLALDALDALEVLAPLERPLLMSRASLALVPLEKTRSLCHGFFP